jgi:hypothetical protein
MKHKEQIHEQIQELNVERYKWIEQLHQIGDDQKLENEINDKIDDLGLQIYDLIYKNINELDFDFMFDQLSYLGHCVNLLNDDNGHWAVTGTGFQNVGYGDKPEDIETQFFIEAKNWKNTPREALLHYLSEEEN